MTNINRKLCIKCKYYHGQFYNDTWFNCAIHPNGIDKCCLDFEPNRRLKPCPHIFIDEYPLILDQTHRKTLEEYLKNRVKVSFLGDTPTGSEEV